MLKNLMAHIWRGVPASLKRWTLRITNARFTVTAGSVIFNQQGQVLLLKHRFRAGSGWGLPGGFIKKGEQPLDALRRELEEEIALKIENAEVFWARSFAGPRQIEILFIAETQALPNPQSIEVESSVWFSPDSLPTGLPKDQKSLIERAVEKRKV
jgi:8-oxo-dGTP diphosphatase